jgi:hypothetical protein
VSRSEGKIGADDAQPVDASDIFEALRAVRQKDVVRRQSAVSCYLSASEGWEKASSMLGGAFAAQDEWLRTDKED